MYAVIKLLFSIHTRRILVSIHIYCAHFCLLQEHDGADDLLNAERSHLLNCKKALEAQLRSVQQQLHVSSPLFSK